MGLSVLTPWLLKIGLKNSFNVILISLINLFEISKDFIAGYNLFQEIET